jgi:hypothetical protein
MDQLFLEIIHNLYSIAKKCTLQGEPIKGPGARFSDIRICPFEKSMESPLRSNRNVLLTNAIEVIQHSAKNAPCCCITSYCMLYVAA